MSTTWPTSEQFDQAHQHGTEYALREHANGATEAQESPLDGQWADAITPRDVANNVGFTDTFVGSDAMMELADAWERGYFDAWTHIIGGE